MATLSLFGGGLFRSTTESIVPTPPTGVYQQEAYLFRTPRPTAVGQVAGTANTTQGSEQFFAINVAPLLESLSGHATIASAGAGVTGGGATVGTLALDTGKTKLGAMFTNMVQGSYGVIWDIILSDASRHRVLSQLVIDALPEPSPPVPPVPPVTSDTFVDGSGFTFVDGSGNIFTV